MCVFLTLDRKCLDTYKLLALGSVSEFVKWYFQFYFVCSTI